jgi:hypothetical protein
LVFGLFILDLFNLFGELRHYIQSVDVAFKPELLKLVFGQLFVLRLRNHVDLGKKVRDYLVLNSAQGVDMFIITS